MKPQAKITMELSRTEEGMQAAIKAEGHMQELIELVAKSIAGDMVTETQAENILKKLHESVGQKDE